MNPTGYFLLLLPGYEVWQGFNILPLSLTEGFIQGVRQNLSTVPFHAGNRVTLEPGIVDGLSEEDIACTVILSSMMVHDGLAFSLSGIAVAGDSLHRITRLPYFWVEGWMVGNDIHSEIGTLPALSMEEARIAAVEFAESKGYGGTTPCS